MVVDGVSPFLGIKSIYLVWPIFTIKNNLPPWISINMEHVMLALIRNFHNKPIHFFIFVTYLYVRGINYVVFETICNYQFRDMDAYIEPLID